MQPARPSRNDRERAGRGSRDHSTAQYQRSRHRVPFGPPLGNFPENGAREPSLSRATPVVLRASRRELCRNEANSGKFRTAPDKDSSAQRRHNGPSARGFTQMAPHGSLSGTGPPRLSVRFFPFRGVTPTTISGRPARRRPGFRRGVTARSIGPTNRPPDSPSVPRLSRRRVNACRQPRPAAPTEAGGT